MNVLFVCTGNTCRSPMAQALFNNMIKNKGYENDFKADSAGFYVGSDCMTPSNNAVKILAESFKIDISEYKPKNISKELINKADIILCMQQSMKHILQELNIPEIEIDTLSNFVGMPGDVIDPYGGSEEDYLLCAENIKELIGLLVEKIIKNKEENE